jgi:DNA anti-recombination protein RmuC
MRSLSSYWTSKGQNQISFLTADVFKNLNQLDKATLSGNDCISAYYEYDGLLTDLMEEVTSSCTACDQNATDFKICMTLRKLETKQEKLREDYEARLHVAESNIKTLVSNEKSLITNLESLEIKSRTDLKAMEKEVKEKFEEKLSEVKKKMDSLKNDDLEKLHDEFDEFKINEISRLQEEVDELKRIQAANVAKWKSFTFKATVVSILIAIVVVAIVGIFVARNFGRFRSGDKWGEISTDVLQRQIETDLSVGNWRIKS